MVRRILIAVVALVVLYFTWQFYTRWRAQNSLASGEIHSVDSGSDSVANDPPRPAPQPTPTVQQPVAAPTTAPVTDSQSPNAPEGSRFAGSGKYQVYRQGNITYRIDTETGQECVLLATDEEWKKPRVYSRGCGKS